MATPEEMGAYYEGFPNPDDPSTWGGEESFEDAKANFEAAKGPAPSPSPVPGPPSPGAGMPAARIADLCAHGGAIIGPGCATVIIGYMPAVRAMPAMDTAACPMFDGLIPHASGTILKGSNSVLIGMFPAARVSDPVGPPANCKGNAIAKGEPTVLIGDSGAGGGGPSAASIAEAQAAAAAAQAAEAMAAQAASTAAALVQAAAAGTPLVQMAPPCQRMQEASEETKHAVAFQVVYDADDVPVPGVQLKITLPDGTVEAHVTDGDGRIVIEDIERPGACSVTCDLKGARLPTTLDFVAMGEVRAISPGPIRPASSGASPEAHGRVIAEIEEHKVKTGESIKSLAVANGMTWQELALFNWGTAVPTEINKHLREDVGCTRKTADGYNYMFDGSDDPGLVYIPRKWAQSALMTDQEHTIRVWAVFELQFVLVSQDSGHRLCFHDFVVRDEGGGEVTRGRTNAEGVGRAAVGRPGEYWVEPGPSGRCRLAGMLFASDGVTPLKRFKVSAEDWTGTKFQVTSNEAGEFEIASVAQGEVVFTHDDVKVIARASQDSERVSVRLLNVPAEGDELEGGDQDIETLPRAPDAKPPPEDA